MIAFDLSPAAGGECKIPKDRNGWNLSWRWGCMERSVPFEGFLSHHILATLSLNCNWLRSFLFSPAINFTGIPSSYYLLNFQLILRSFCWEEMSQLWLRISFCLEKDCLALNFNFFLVITHLFQLHYQPLPFSLLSEVSCFPSHQISNYWAHLFLIPDEPDQYSLLFSQSPFLPPFPHHNSILFHSHFF